MIKENKMRIAFLNIQNLFFRHHGLLEKPKNQCVLNWISEMDTLVHKRSKKSMDLDRIQELSFLLGFDKIDTNKYALMRSRGGKVYLRNSDFPVSEKATEGNKWNGWVELMNSPIHPMATSHKGRLIAETNADILLLQEVEDRESLIWFNHKILSQYPDSQYSRKTVVSGNDLRGVEEGLLLKRKYRLNKLRTYSDELDENGKYIFERNCAEFSISTPHGKQVLILTVRFVTTDSNKEASDEKRLKQSTYIAELYRFMRTRGKKNIIITGSLNAPSYCYSLAPLLQETDLKDCCRHPNFESSSDTVHRQYHRLGAYQKGINTRQTDYLLLSPELFKKVEKTGLNRKGIWSKNPAQWEVYRTLKTKNHQASAHPLLWAQFNL